MAALTAPTAAARFLWGARSIQWQSSHTRILGRSERQSANTGLQNRGARPLPPGPSPPRPIANALLWQPSVGLLADYVDDVALCLSSSATINGAGPGRSYSHVGYTPSIRTIHAWLHAGSCRSVGDVLAGAGRRAGGSWTASRGLAVALSSTRGDMRRGRQGQRRVASEALPEATRCVQTWEGGHVGEGGVDR